jgi:hypothetical protein
MRWVCRPSLKGRAQENRDDIADLLFADQVGAEAEHVAVIVLARPAGGELIVDERGAHAVDLVGSDAHADTAAVEEDADLVRAVGHRLACGEAKSG